MDRNYGLGHRTLASHFENPGNLSKSRNCPGKIHVLRRVLEDKTRHETFISLQFKTPFSLQA